MKRHTESYLEVLLVLNIAGRQEKLGVRVLTGLTRMSRWFPLAVLHINNHEL